MCHDYFWSPAMSSSSFQNIFIITGCPLIFHYPNDFCHSLLIYGYFFILSRCHSFSVFAFLGSLEVPFLGEFVIVVVIKQSRLPVFWLNKEFDKTYQRMEIVWDLQLELGLLRQIAFSISCPYFTIRQDRSSWQRLAVLLKSLDTFMYSKFINKE